MVNTIDMQDIMHLNLFAQITKIDTRFCAKYNNAIIFCVPKNLLSRALGEQGKNLRKLSETFGRKIVENYFPCRLQLIELGTAR